MKHREYPVHCAPAGLALWQMLPWNQHEENSSRLPYGCPGLANFAGYTSNFWSSSPNANNSNNAWNVNFNNGNANRNNRNNNQHVRLVRSGE